MYFIMYMYVLLYYYIRSTPVEVLHTILLGACKYMLRTLMKRLKNPLKKEEFQHLIIVDFQKELQAT